jgi:predicted polyphosphate/ATP-dependent NAD kinase
VVGELLSGQIVSSVLRQVRDFAESTSVSEGIAVRTYGELRVPEAGMWLQQTKVGGKESEPLAVEEIIADLQAQSLLDRPLVIGAGSTCQALKHALIEGGTLRGVDVRKPDGEWQFDVTEKDLLALSNARLVVSFTRQQGFLFGRGNQVLSGRFLRGLTWPDDVVIVGTRNKLLSLEGRPLLVDTGDRALDEALCGIIEIVSGFEDRLLYRVAVDYAVAAHP